MFMFKKPVELTEVLVELKKKDNEIECLKEEVEDKKEGLEIREKQLEEKNWEITKLEEMNKIDITKAKDEVRKEMQESLITSDLKRVEAVAKLNTYIDMDTKEERKHIQKMLEKAIEGLGKTKVEIKK